MTAGLVVGLAAAAAAGGLWARRVARDPVTVLAAFVLLVVAIPSRWVLHPFGAIGQPALLVGLAGAWWWWVARVGRDRGLDRAGNPVRVAVLTWAWLLMVTFALGWTRALTPLELRSSVRDVVLLACLCGIALLAVDGIGSVRRLDTLMSWVVWSTAGMAGVGLVQFATGVDPLAGLDLPVLRSNGVPTGLTTRSAFARPLGTAAHAIEYGVVLGAVLPLAIHRALHPTGPRVPPWVPVGVIGVGLATSLTRSAVVSAVTAGVVLAVVWSPRRRAVGAALASVSALALWVAVPGLIGTFLALFENASIDPSITAREARVPRVLALWSQDPLVGRGFGTFSVDDYFLLDNQVYVTLIESGLVGIVAWLLVIGWPARACIRATSRADDPALRHLAQALIACACALLVSFATFDAFFYRIVTGLLLLSVGCMGALVRVSRTTQGRRADIDVRGDRRVRS